MATALKHILYDFSIYNVLIFYYLNKLGNVGYLPNILSALSSLFRIWCFGVYYILLCFYQYYLLQRNHDPVQKIVEYYKRFHALVYIGICYAVFGCVFAALKFSINLPRPYCSLPEGSFRTIADLSSSRCLSSFPSAHTGLALLMTICAWKYMNKYWRAFSVAIVILVAWSRITKAMHYPADILYSMIITICIVIISRGMFHLLQNNVIAYCAKKLQFLFSVIN